MKKMSVHLSLLCLLGVLAVPMVGCGGGDAEVEESTTTAMEEPMATTTEPMGTEMTPPPAQ